MFYIVIAGDETRIDPKPEEVPAFQLNAKVTWQSVQYTISSIEILIDQDTRYGSFYNPTQKVRFILT